MSNEPSPLKFMGTQSQETVSMAAALALVAERERDRRSHEGGESGDVDDVAGNVAGVASRAIAQGKDKIGSMATSLRVRGTTALARRTEEDPIRTVLVAAGAGALLMMILASVARSGVRLARKSVR